MVAKTNSKVIAKIREETTSQLEQLSLATEEQHTRFQEKYQREIDDIVTKNQKSLVEEFQREIEIFKTLQRLRLKESLLKFKHDLIQQLKEEIVTDICKNQDYYKAFFQAICRQGMVTGDEQITLRPQDRDLFKEICLPSLTEHFDDAGQKKGSFSISTRANLSPGVLIQQGEKEIDATLSCCVDELFKKHEPAIIKQLFG